MMTSARILIHDYYPFIGNPIIRLVAVSINLKYDPRHESTKQTNTSRVYVCHLCVFLP